MFFRFFLLCNLLIGLLGGVQVSSAYAVSSSPSGMTVEPALTDTILHEDGTLNLDGSFSGSLDLKGWDVTMDAQRGPVFSQSKSSNSNTLLNIPGGSWEALGTGGSAINYFIADIVVVGSDVYVSGGFQNAGSIPEADYVARWDGSAWHALGSNGAGNGSISGVVYDL